MFIVAWFGGAYSEPCQTSEMIFFAKMISGYQGEIKTLSNIWDGAFLQVALGYRDEFRTLSKIHDGVFVLLLIMINFGITLVYL